MWWLSLIPIIGTSILGIFLHTWEDRAEWREINKMADRDRRRMKREPSRDTKRLMYATIGGTVKSVRL